MAATLLLGIVRRRIKSFILKANVADDTHTCL